ncbi:MULTISPECIES: DMT family transporter [Halocynthiibacter]|uniref:DMT family transporter n=1 Tax=Halocynthiibacter halioticoli TaxID=2986804 RepID=A0AAE3LQ58_9RHOB|nr:MULTISPECIES: DMT family transporter [Halocynthiibacter]MCV6823183.1 DMT family transporter [Halocynthiibacter halioticoli]MCW4056184.1 DMT family transporter [Halocynthiibacter sp. SDUM655004]
MAKLTPNAKGAILALIAFAIFATHDVIVKSLGGTYSPFQIVFFSVLLGFPLVTLMLIQDASRDTLRPRHPYWMALRTGAAVVTGASAFYAFAHLPLAQTYAILFASPLLITILAIPILGERVRLRRGLAVAVGLAGVLIVLRPGQADLSAGHIAAMVAAVGGAISSIIVRKIGPEERSAVLLLYPMIGNFVVMGCAMPFVYVPMPFADFAALGVIALLAFIAMIFQILAYRNGEAVIVAPMQYSQIIWASIFGYFIFNEQVDAMTYIGAGVIILSGIYIVVRESAPNASANTPVLRTRSRAGTFGGLRVGALIRRAQRNQKRADDINEDR